MDLPRFSEHACPTKIVAGQRALSQLPFEMGHCGSTRALIVTSRDMTESGLQRYIEQVFTDAHGAIGAWFEDVDTHASLRTARDIATLFTQTGCDSFIAVGGGSCMDAAKAACLLANTKTDDLTKAAIHQSGLPKIFAVPRAFAPGFLVTPLAELFDEEKNRSTFVASNQIIPCMAVLDPQAALKVDTAHKAAYAMEALARAMETCILNEEDPVADIYAKTAIELIRKFLEPALAGTDREADQALANASLYAGIAFGQSAGIINAAVYAVHALSLIPTGSAAAMLLPGGLKYYAVKVPERILSLAGILEGPARRQAEAPPLDKILHRIVVLQGLTGLPPVLKVWGVDRPTLDRIARLAASEYCPFFHDGAFTSQDVLGLLLQAYDRRAD